MTSKIQTSLSSRELLDDLVPKLKATEHFLHETLIVKVGNCPDPREKLCLQNLRTEIELEIAMIRMNLEHLLRRYSEQLVDSAEGEGNTMLALDDHEAVAIESIRRIYARADELQTHTGWN